MRAVDGASFCVARAEVCALVGESGCGKTATALALARLHPEPPALYPHGTVKVGGVSVLDASPQTMRRIRGKRIAYVFQEPGTALNPVVTVGKQVAECVRLHRPGMDPAGEGLRFLSMAGLGNPDRIWRCHPHELSGGMKQRAVIAMALACGPDILVADEPTTALDVTIQAQILELLARLRKELGMAILLITHNLALVAEMADSVHVMYAGMIVESGPAPSVLARPAHPYTAALLRAVPRLSRRHDSPGARLRGIPGSVPDPSQRPEWCRFAGRCDGETARCREAAPPETRPADGRTVRCWHALGAEGGSR